MRHAEGPALAASSMTPKPAATAADAAAAAAAAAAAGMGAAETAESGGKGKASKTDQLGRALHDPQAHVEQAAGSDDGSTRAQGQPGGRRSEGRGGRGARRSGARRAKGSILKEL